MAPLARLRSALAALAAAGVGEGKVHEHRLKLDMGPFDAHLARVDGCLRSLVERPGAKPGDCLSFSDAALARCEAAFGAELDACMSEAERSPGMPMAVTDLMPELRRLRQDVVHCYDTEGIRPMTVQTLDGPLKRCGLVQLVHVLPELSMKATEEQIRKFLANRETFLKYHPGAKDKEDEPFPGAARVHGRPANLEGGRYELVPPAEEHILDLVHFLTSRFNTPRLVTEVWGHDHRDQAQLAYVVVRAQHKNTSLVVDQPWHQDRDTTEDVRVQTAVHPWSAGDGLLEFLPTSHRLHRRLRPPDAAFPRGRRVDEAMRGDMLLYFPRLRHRGTKRSAKRPRVTMDLVLHSVNRQFHEESERDPEHVAARFLPTQHARKALDTFKGLWRKRTELNVMHPEL